MDTIRRFQLPFFFLLAFRFQLVPSASQAQTTPDNTEESLKLTVQIRPRAEYRNGLFTPILDKQTAAGFVVQRSRLGIHYTKENKLTVGLEVQMLGTWGNDPQVQGNSSNINLFQAWVQFPILPHLDIKIGRQILSYDDERILGELDWNNAGRKHDAALFRFKKEKFSADFAAAYNQNSERVTNDFYNDTNSQPYKTMELLWLNYQPIKPLSVSLLAINIARQNSLDSQMSYLQTIGFNAGFKQKKLSLNLSSYYQTGQNKTPNAPNTQAWMASIYANYDFSNKFSIGLGSDYLSGQDMGSIPNKNTVFVPLYGTQHKFYGSMDYFYAGSAHQNVGLWDNYFSARYKPVKNFSTQLTWHHFQAASKVLDYSAQAANPQLGDELDLSLQYQLENGIKLSGGYSQFFASESIKYVKNTPKTSTLNAVQNWVWLSLNFNPEIFLFTR
ncbi:MAG: alginate export family protein [Bacteroidetes bacterium]|nr:alginate export family protein [Bacteroidota bacterium]